MEWKLNISWRISAGISSEIDTQRSLFEHFIGRALQYLSVLRCYLSITWSRLWFLPPVPTVAKKPRGKSLSVLDMLSFLSSKSMWQVQNFFFSVGNVRENQSLPPSSTSFHSDHRSRSSVHRRQAKYIQPDSTGCSLLKNNNSLAFLDANISHLFRFLHNFITRSQTKFGLYFWPFEWFEESLSVPINNFLPFQLVNDYLIRRF